MEIKFNNYIILDWIKHNSGRYERKIYSIEYDDFLYSGVIFVHNHYHTNNYWNICFGRDSFGEEYKSMYGRYDLKIFSNYHDARNHVDQFLNKLVKLKEFL